jgi:rubrerythrin
LVAQKMPIYFNTDEILQMAERIERNGARFYTLAAERLPAARDILLQLASQEEEHLKIFVGMRRNLSAADREAVVSDPDNESSLYLQAMADREVFNIDESPEKLLPASVSLADVIRLAIGKEKDSIVFYTGMKEMVPQQSAGAQMDSIIREEFRHISVLREIAGKQ